MPRHSNYIPHGVIPAVLLPFDNDLAIDEQSFYKHLWDVASVENGCRWICASPRAASLD
jgi:4-hydroxy-tetrahydrodipicolinate synthase